MKNLTKIIVMVSLLILVPVWAAQKMDSASRGKLKLFIMQNKVKAKINEQSYRDVLNKFKAVCIDRKRFPHEKSYTANQYINYARLEASKAIYGLDVFILSSVNDIAALIKQKKFEAAASLAQAEYDAYYSYFEF